MKKLLAIASALTALTVSPAFAWHQIVIYNRTDPVFIETVTFTAPGTPPVKYVVNVPKNGFRVFGPLPANGPCLRSLAVEWRSPVGDYSMTAPTQMNVCTEGYILATSGAVLGGWQLSITHGVGPGPAGNPVIR